MVPDPCRSPDPCFPDPISPVRSWRWLLVVAALFAPGSARAHETTAPVLTVKVEPVYPADALAAGVEGTVVMQIYLDAQGSVQHVHLVSSPGFGLDAAALAAAQGFQFKPATSDGVPVASQVVFEQRFAVSRTLRSAVTGASPSPDPAPLPVLEDPRYRTVVLARGPLTSASASEVRDRDFELRPRASPNDILRVVPGLVTAQHQGGGKADQIFLRGFDADHGTDVAVALDGVPVNLPSHAHGQGFADLHFVIPEVLQTVQVQKGSYYPELGDFDTAGAVNLVTREGFDRSFVSLSGQWFRLDPTQLRREAGNGRLLAVVAPDSASYVAVEAAQMSGPFAHGEGLRRFSLFAKTTREIAPNWKLGALVTAYGSQWVGSGQIPARLVGTPELPTRFDALDASEGGSTQRNSASVFLEARPDPLARFSLRLYAIQYKLALWNDFSFFLDDAVNGDEIEQDDARVVTGLDTRYELNRRWGRASAKTVLGAQVRRDDAHVDVWDATSQNGSFRRRLRRHVDASPFHFGNDADIRIQNLGLFASEDVAWTPWLRTVVGLRGDYFNYDVADGNPLPPAPPGAPSDAAGLNPSGVRQVALLSPKASLVLSPRHNLDLYLNYGNGFHSNDARLAVTGLGGHVVPRSYQGEVGVRARVRDRLDLAAALWGIYLQSEIVFEGDAGTFSPSGATRRYGLDLEARYRLLPWLWADADVALAHASFVANGGNGGAVALAPRLAYTGGITARHPRGFKAALRVRGVGDRPILDPGDEALLRAAGQPVPVAQGYTLVDVFAGYEVARWELVAALENALDAGWREAQFANRSCSRAENAAAASPCSQRDANGAPTNAAAILPDVHFTPGNPINLTLTARLYF
jgi:TonB family protein